SAPGISSHLREAIARVSGRVLDPRRLYADVLRLMVRNAPIDLAELESSQPDFAAAEVRLRAFIRDRHDPSPAAMAARVVTAEAVFAGELSTAWREDTLRTAAAVHRAVELLPERLLIRLLRQLQGDTSANTVLAAEVWTQQLDESAIEHPVHRITTLKWESI